MQDGLDAEVYRIAYISRCRIALSDDGLAHLGEQSAARNNRSGVTGLLLYDGRRFIQAIEGRQDRVDAIMARIAKDPRHDMIEIVARGLSDERRFGSWAMACERVEAGCCTPEFLIKIKERMQAVEDPFLQAVFIGFARLGIEKNSSDQSRRATVAERLAGTHSRSFSGRHLA